MTECEHCGKDSEGMICTLCRGYVCTRCFEGEYADYHIIQCEDELSDREREEALPNV